MPGNCLEKTCNRRVAGKIENFMAPPPPQSGQSLGFLTVVEDQKHGLFGGYLVLNGMGRPLEFHCTAPVKANRAQEILYGPTLRPYLYGEQIGRTLFEQSKTIPLVVLTDSEPMLSVGEFIPPPVALVEPGVCEPSPEAGDPRTPIWRTDSGHVAAGPHREAFTIGQRHLAVEAGGTPLGGQLVEDLQRIAASWDLAEPFDRIRAAIDEARRGGQ